MLQSFLFALIHFKIFTSYNQLPKSWDEIAPNDLMLSDAYLKALELATPDNINLYYIAIFKEEDLVGIAITERVQLYVKDMFRKSASSVLTRFFKDAISMVLKGNILVVGNLTHTGQHGIGFCKDKIDPNEFLRTVLEAISAMRNKIKSENGKKIRLVLFKDYFLDDEIHNASKVFFDEKYNRVIVQPNMILKIESNWHKKEDYIKSLNKKYKVRFQRARRKFGPIERRELDIETLKRDSDQIHALYRNVSDNAKFNTFILPENHFYSLKQELQHNFRLFGYYLNNELIGFYTLILNNEVLETYFLGYDSEHQHPNQLYLNMLFDMVEFGIVNKFSSVVYARTAMEIKSSVGAKPIAMTMYIKHTSGMINSILKRVFNFMKPDLKWEERHPFINEKP